MECSSRAVPSDQNVCDRRCIDHHSSAMKLPNNMGSYIGTAMNLVPFLRSHHTSSAICLSLVDTNPFHLFSSPPRKPIWHSAGIQFRNLDESLVRTKRLLRYSVHEEPSFAYEQSITDRVHRVLLYPFQGFVLALEVSPGFAIELEVRVSDLDPVHWRVGKSITVIGTVTTPCLST